MALFLQQATPMDFTRRNVCVLIYAVISLGALNAWADDSCTPAHSTGTDVAIPLSDDGLPASDLVCDAACMAKLGRSGSPQILFPEDAQTDKGLGLDLSALEPDLTTDVFTGTQTSADESQDTALSVQNWEEVNYTSDICSSSGRYRFNIQTQGTATQPGQTMTLMLSKDLHSFLLRKELLRKLGYKIPPIKFLPHVKVKFPNTTVKTAAGNMRLIDAVLTRWLPLATDGNAKDWCGMAKSALEPLLANNKDYPCTPVPDSDTNADPYTIELQDVILMQATPTYYDLAIGPPIEQIPGTTNLRPESMRIVRALALVYGLLNIPESVNLFAWNAATLQNGNVTVHVPDQANFSTTLDDALWILRRLGQLSRKDFQEIVTNSYYPEPVAKVVTEKLIARRDSLLSMFGVKASPITPPTNFNISDGSDLKNGKLLTQNFPGYATRFATGDPQSPLKGIGWYVLSEVQANAMEGVMNYVNNEIPSLNVQDALQKHLAQIAANMASGKTTSIKFGPWYAPVLNGSVQISREVVFGQYMGTNNLVQLADNFGFTANAGFATNFDGLPSYLALSGSVQGTLNVTLTHLKPLMALKDSVTQPLQNMIVAWVFKDASDAFLKIAAEKTGQNLQDPAVLKKVNDALANDVDALKKYLGPGESLILQVSVSGQEGVSAGLQPANWMNHHNLMPSVGPTVNLNEQYLSRLHLYRGDDHGTPSTTILLFNDNGGLIGPELTINANLGSTVQFPIFSLTAQGIVGKAQSKIFQFSLVPDAQANASIFDVSGGIAAALRTGSTSVLESQLKIKPNLLSTHFHDSSSSIQLLHWVRRTLKTNGRIELSLKDGTIGEYVTLTDGKQTGASYQQLGTQSASYFLERLLNNNQYAVDTSVNPNPGQSFYGHSQTRDAQFQAQASGVNPVDPFVTIQYRWQGWNMTKDDAQKLVDSLYAKYGVKFYDDGFMGTATDIKMYELMLNLNVYEAGINQLLSMTKANEKAFEVPYYQRYRCDLYASYQIDQMSGDEIHKCASMQNFQATMNDGRKASKDADKRSQVMLKAVSNLEQFADFADFVKLLGAKPDGTSTDGKARIYIGSQITGFPEGSEDITDPINATRGFGLADSLYPNGVVSWVENNYLGIEDGEFSFKWLEPVL